MSDNLAQIKSQILTALGHKEASDGLYFRNFQLLHEEDERPAVEGSQVELLEALKELLQDEVITMDDSGEEAIFHLSSNGSSS